jgi:nucleoside phosphorylase
MFNPSDYTVGWICAITTEYVAAQSLLDEKHGKPEYVSSFDTNDYILGKMSNHNVVITVLPGEHGTDSAATAATNMLHSFPNVRFGLMVGTGGGAPGPKQDIRLGDVVVSTPCNGFGGVYQYDYGKAIQGQSFKPTRFLNQPPVVLRAAINGIQARYERKGHRLEETIDKVLEKHKRMRQKYKRPPYDHDRLYESQTVHPLDTEASCAEKCDSAKLILCPPRTEYEGNPMIHYGLIASGNQLMNDALARDKFVAEDGVLCFEMEAAGLMNMFPCLVVRGICNYSDSHGTKEWQGYAAMTAAAYAKDLLRQIIPSKMETEAKLKKDISGKSTDATHQSA